MAKKELAFEASVDIGDSAKSVRTLKQEFKEAQKELDGLGVGTSEYIKQLEKLGGLKDKIADLNEEINAFDGGGSIVATRNVIGGLASGFQAAQGAAALFGAEGEELQKTLLKVQAASAFADGIKGIEGLGNSFKVLGQVIKANPLMLIATIIIGIGTALFALKDKIGIVGDAFDAIGKAIGWVTDKIKEFTDWLGISTFAAEEQAEAVVNAAKKQQEALTQRYDDEIALANAAGKATFELEQKKQIAILDSAKIQIEALKSVAKAQGEWTEEQLKELEALGKVIHDASLAIRVNNEKEHQEQLNTQKKANEEYSKHLEEEHKKQLAYAQAMADAVNKEADAYDALVKKQKQQRREAQEQGLADAMELANKMIEENNREHIASLELIAIQNESELQAQVAYLDAKMALELENKELTESEKKLIEERYRQEKEELEEQHNQAMASATLDSANNTANALQSLSDAVFSIKMQNLQKGSKAELELAKKQFKINKALAITQATISTIQGVINALTAQSAIPEPYGTILKAVNAVAVGVAGAANIAKISSQQFNAGGGGGGASVADAGSVSVAPPSTGSTMLNPDGTIKKPDGKEPESVKAIVVETDITKTQKRVNSIEEKSKIG